MRTSRFRLNAAVTPSGSSYASSSVGFALDEIRAEQEQIAGRQGAPDPIEERSGGRRIEVSEVRSEQQHEHRTVAPPLRNRTPQADFVRGLMADHREVPQPSEPLLRLLERLRGDVDQVHARRSASGLQRFGEQHELLAAAATQLDDRAVVCRRWWRRSGPRACDSRRLSARVMRYHGSRQMASKRLEPSAS